MKKPCVRRVCLVMELILISGCSSHTFTATTVRPRPAVTPLKASNLLVNFMIASGAKTLSLSAEFHSKAAVSASQAVNSLEYELVAGSVVPKTANGFSETLAHQIALSKFSATMIHVPAQADSNKLQIVVETHGITDNGKNLPDQKMIFVQSSPSASWKKDEGSVSAFGSQGGQATPVANCGIQSNGQQAVPGNWAAILTNPAPCDFRLPTVGITDLESGFSARIPIGSYWSWDQNDSAMALAQSFGGDIAHPFNLNSNYNIRIDNGFILIQPDNKSYLLVDAGQARPNSQQYLSAGAIASNLSQALGFGSTTLMQPSAGMAGDNFAGSTVFKKGSVIALYDDTPDMHGSVDVNSLIAVSVPVVSIFTLSWNALAKEI